MTNALHYSDGKSGVDQIPPEILLELGEIYTYGAFKYGRDNWKAGTNWHEFYGSALRHLFAYWSGQDYDHCDDSEGCEGRLAARCKKHSRMHHLAHALWNIGTLRYYQMNGLGVDTR